MNKTLTRTAKLLIAGLLTASLSPQLTAAEPTTMSKPKGATGSGTTIAGQAKTNQFWWPDQLDLSSLRDHDARSNPLGDDFNYKTAFNQLDMDAVKADLSDILTDSQDWWPADFGNYGPFFIRLSWHSSGTY
ncbi:MAG: catalase-peroxidase, partial [Candidatus Azotimanducaceae bacterium]